MAVLHRIQKSCILKSQLIALAALQVIFSSLTAFSVLAGEKLVLFGRYVQDFYVGIVQ